MTNNNMKTSSPAEIMGSSDKLLTELFLRIPLKPLFRLKLVSKHWNSLISDPKLRNKKPVGFLFQNHSPFFKLVEHALLLSLDHRPSITELHIFKRKGKEMGSKVLHSCNGLLVGYSNAYITRSDNTKNQLFQVKLYYRDYFVYNPTTGEYKSIDPPSPSASSSLWMYLAFDPSDSPHYKIVCVSWPETSSDEYLKTGIQKYTFMVYSSKTRSWKKYDNTFSSKFINFEKGVYWNGSIHWISFSETEKSICFTPPDHDDVCGSHSLTVRVMPTPPILGGDKTRNYFGESCDHLNFISYYGSDEYKLQVYEMRRDYSEWFVKYNVDVSNVWGRGLGNFSCPKSFAVCGLVRGKKSDDDDNSFLFLLIKRRMVVYNVVTGSFEITGEFDEEEYHEVYDKFNSFSSGKKHSTDLYCPLQYIESHCSV